MRNRTEEYVNELTTQKNFNARIWMRASPRETNEHRCRQVFILSPPYRRPHLTAFVGTLEQHKDDRVCGGTGGVQYQSLSPLLPFDQLLLRICEAAPTFNEHTAHIKICSRIFRTSQIQNRTHLWPANFPFTMHSLYLASSSVRWGFCKHDDAHRFCIDFFRIHFLRGAIQQFYIIVCLLLPPSFFLRRIIANHRPTSY